jgi:hypothetical protein
MSCSLTVKYRSYQLAAAQQSGGPLHYDEIEQIHGPFAFVSKEMDDGYPVVHCHLDNGDPGLTLGPCRLGDMEEAAGGPQAPPRPTVWVMNYYGATIAKYDL